MNPPAQLPKARQRLARGLDGVARQIEARLDVVTPILGGGTQTRAVDAVDIIRTATVRGHLYDVIETLGSDARLTRVESLPAALFEPPARLLEAFRPPGKGLRVVAVTPLCFENGWLPNGFEESGGTYSARLPRIDNDVILRAAFAARPTHVSGWDMAANEGKGAPKPTSRMVAPGAVYFFERADGKAFGEADARSLWPAAAGGRTDDGFGRVALGVWNPRAIQ